MRQVIFLLTVVATLVLGAPLRAQERYWLQIEAQPGLADAEDRARAYAALFPDVAGFATGTGWYAIALGPYLDRELAASQLARLRREGLIPRDSFVADGTAFDAPFWPAGAAAPLPEVAAPEIAAAEPEAPAEPPAEPVAEPLAAAEPATPPATVAEADPLPVPPTEAVPAETAEAAPTEAAPVPAAPVEETADEARASEAALSAEDRQTLQTALQWFGFYNARIDGAFGPGTRRSMADWQTANGLEPTGILTTRQRDQLLTAWRAEEAALGLQTITQAEAGIEITLPTALVEFDHFEPPFVHYRAKAGSGVKVVLISQPGDQAALYGLYDVLQTLADVPLQGERSRSERSFTIDANNGAVASHTYAELSKGLIKGYMLVWRPQDELKIARARDAMQASFRSVGDKALDPGLVPMSDESRRGLLSGLEIRRPELSRTGFFVDAEGATLTTREVVEGCNRITLDLRHEADVVFSDAPTGLALLRPKTRLAPPAVAEFLSGQPRSGQEIAVSGYSYEDTLPAPTLSFGQLEDIKGLDGETGIARLSIRVLAGDAGGPVLDASGAVLGMLLPRDTTGTRRLPDDVSYALQTATVAARLSTAGIVPRAASSGGALAPEDLNRRAEGMTVLVSCW